MEVSSATPHLPLDFSVTMVNIKINGSHNNNNSTHSFESNSNALTSAFKVVTPKGKTDG
jgi:hypothetical protein